MTAYSAVAWAKVNLYLKVTGIAVNGYHTLDSLIAFADYGDVITLTDSDKITLEVTGPFAPDLTRSTCSDGNLVTRTAVMMQKLVRQKTGVHITLEKNIPIGAGLGGGSSDAATTARLLRTLWKINISDDKLAEYLLPLGADIAVCTYAVASHVVGIGEVDSLIPFTHNIAALIVSPGVFVSTADIFSDGFSKFAEITPSEDIPVESVSLIPWLKKKNNDLEQNAIAREPVISEVLNIIAELPNCEFSRMSGSGSACFGVFKSPQDALAARTELEKKRPHWNSIATVLH